MKNNFVLLFLAAFILTAICGIGSAYTETRLSTNTADQWNPSLWRDYIVWQDARNGGSDIYLTDMAKKIQTRVTSKVDAQNPCVAGTKIVWDDNRNGNRDIYMYDISTKTTTRITSDKYNQINPVTYDKYIVWLDDSKGYSDVCLYNMTTKKVTRLTSGTYIDNVAIYDTKIVYSSYYQASMYDIKTKKTVIIGNPYSSVVCIYGTKIFYWDNFDESIPYLYDYSKGTTTEVNWPDVRSMYSNKVVWTDYRNGNADIYMAQI